MSSDITIEESSGNVFADFGIPNAQEHLSKADLAHEIRLAIRERGLTQTQAAALLGTSQARVSEVLSGRVQGMTYDRLIGFLNSLGRDVKFTVSDRRSVSANAQAGTVSK